MSIHSLVLLPFMFGLIGFVEPCSIGINLIILNRIKEQKRMRRIWETLIFTFVRGSFLALMGLSAAFVGSKIIPIQSSLFLFLGGIYILSGVLALMNKYKPAFSFEINMGKYFQNKGSVALGLVFGPVIPACAIPLVLALIGKSILIGNLLQGFVSLLIFGIGLSSPLIGISYSNKSNEIITKISEKARKVPWLAGVVLIIVGLLTMLSSSWWAEAAI
jgi:cytochrome c-type biogenesis protein